MSDFLDSKKIITTATNHHQDIVKISVVAFLQTKLHSPADKLAAAPPKP